VLGKRLIKLRGTKTQQEVSNKLNISRARYSHYENERVEPDTEILKRMADYFNVSVDYLLGRSDSPSSGPDRQSDDENLFFFNEENITPEEMEELKKHLEFLRFKAKQENEKK
jgi:transcriptional regulator with XRE-family HTH domain